MEGVAGDQEGLEAREDKHPRTTSSKAEQAASEAETSLDEYQRQLADARNEAGRIIEEARQPAEQVRQDLHRRGPRPRSPRSAPRAAEDIRLATERAMADLQGRVAELSIELAEKVVERNLDRETQIQPHRELHQPGREQLAVPSTRPRRGLRRRAARGGRAEGTLADIEDELFRFARTFEGNDELRTALTDPALPAERRVAVVEDLLGGKALPASAALASFVVGAGRASELPEIVDRFVELAAAEQRHEVAEVRSARSRSTTEQTERLAEAL